MPHKILKPFFVLILFLIVNEAYSQWQVINSGVTANLVDGCFVTDSTGFVLSSGGTILKTLDAGNTWTTNANLTGYFTSICHVGTDTIYAGGNCIYRSDDGGVSWNLITTLSFTLTDIGFFASNNGYAIVPNYSYCTWVDGLHTFDEFMVYKTIDNGTTWQFDFGDRESTSRFQFINDSTAYVTGGYVSVIAHCSGPWYSTSKRTNNKGSTWSSFLQPNFGHSHFSFINDSTGYFVQPGNEFSIFKTLDGGNSLVESYTEIFDNSIKQCKFINAIDGYLLGRNNIYVTASNGFCWNSDYSSNDSLNFLFQNTTNLLFAAGSNGVILKKVIIPSAYADTIYRITLNNNSLNFGYINVDSLSSKILTVTNTGSIPQNLSLNSSNDFKISFANVSFVNNLNVTLNPLQDTVLYVQFGPLQAQQYKDTLLITATNLSDVKIPLEGIGFYGLTGNILQDTLVCVDTLRIGGDLTIDSSARVTICAGTYVKIMGNYRITVLGILEALGDSSHRIQFGVNDTSVLWNGIWVDNPDINDTSVFNYCDFIVSCNNPLIDMGQGIVSINHSDFSNPKSRAIRMYSNYSPCKLFISNSSIYDTKGSAIDCDPCDSVYISNNNIYNNGLGITLSSFGSLISGNNIYNNFQEAIFAVGKFTIQKNRIYNNGGGIYFFYGTSVVIENNEIFNNKSTFTGTGGISGEIRNEGGNINQNLIFNNYSSGSGAGIDLYGSPLPVNVTNNTICNNQAGPSRVGNNFCAGGVNVKMLNNIIYNVTDTNNSIAWFQGIHEIKFNCINQDSINIWGQNNIDNNPKFVMATDSIGAMTNLGAYDWSLKASSHCINAGDTIQTFFLLPLDFSANPRIYNNRVDIGAFEYQGDFIEEDDSVAVTDISINSFLLFPNPVNAVFTISLSSYDLSEFTLYDITSRLVLKKEFIKSASINLRHLAKGIYLFEISNKDGLVRNGKLVKD